MQPVFHQQAMLFQLHQACVVRKAPFKLAPDIFFEFLVEIFQYIKERVHYLPPIDVHRSNQL